MKITSVHDVKNIGYTSPRSWLQTFSLGTNTMSVLETGSISSGKVMFILHIYSVFTQEVAVGERIAYWIRTPQVPGSRPGWYGTFY